MKRELFVGVVFASLLAVLLAATLWVRDPGFFEKSGKHPLRAGFREVAGLTPGADVWIYGTPAGRVKTIAPDGQGGVYVDLDLDYDPQLRADATVTIQQKSALGNSVVAIHPGTPAQPAWQGTVFKGSAAAGAFDALEKLSKKVGDLVDEVRGPLKATIENVQKVSGDVAAKSDRIVGNLDTFAENAKAVSADLAEGRGTLGKLLKDDTLHRDLTEAVASLKKIAEDANKGGGTLDVLLHDTKFADDLKSTAANLRGVSDRLERGEGTLGKLLRDDAVYRDLSKIASDLSTVSGDLRAGRGALGKLLYDEAFAKRLDTISDDVATVTSKIRRGEGTLGKLVNDESVYTDLKSALKALKVGTDDVRENAPILTFAGFLFSGF